MSEDQHPGFFGILVWGEGRVSKRVTMVSACMVALGALLSTAWILDANSWMQTPAGYREVSGQFQPVNWFDAIFNPAFDWRFPHMVLAVLVAAAWFIAAIGAYYLLRRRALPLARKTLSIGLVAAAVLLPIQLNVGDNMASYKLLVNQSASSLSIGELIASLAAFWVVYLVLITAWIRQVVREVRRGPDPLPGQEGTQAAAPGASGAPAPAGLPVTPVEA